MLPETGDRDRRSERITSMDRPAAAGVRCAATAATFPAGLTDAHLSTHDDDRLRHLLAALCLHCGVVPAAPARREAA